MIRHVTLRGGPPVHPHIYSKRVYRADRQIRDGDLVEVRTREGRPCGFGFFHSRSLVNVRILSHDPDVFPNEAWLRERIRAAEAIRRDVLRLGDRTNAWRVVHGEGDGLSGLVIDRYGSAASIALYSLGWARRLEELKRVLADELGVESVVARVDAKTAGREGITLDDPGDRPGFLEVEEDGVRFGIDPAGGHKTGFFLDQRDNRRLLASLARGRTVFDGMTYTGGFALAAAKAGAASVRGMDLDEAAVATARDNARRNGLAVRDHGDHGGNGDHGHGVVFEHGDVFDALRAYAAGPVDARPEVLVIDPPKWARDRQGLGAAIARYRDLNRLALQAVRPGGIVCTNSCSGLVQTGMFLDVIRDASLDATSEVRTLAVTGAAPDHPVNPIYPEGRYLKCAFLSAGGEGSGPGHTRREESR